MKAKSDGNDRSWPSRARLASRIRHFRFDLVGGLQLLFVLRTALLSLTSLTARNFPWGVAGLLGLAAVGLAALGGFILVERRTAEPILPLALFANSTFVAASAIGSSPSWAPR